MIEKTDRSSMRDALARFVGFKRSGNPYVKTESLRRNMAEHGFSPEDVGTTEAELQAFDLQDRRWQIGQDLENWRLMDSIGCPEACFAQGVLACLEKGDIRPEDFGITAQELQAIKDTAGPR